MVVAGGAWPGAGSDGAEAGGGTVVDVVVVVVEDEVVVVASWMTGTGAGGWFPTPESVTAAVAAKATTSTRIRSFGRSIGDHPVSPVS